MPNALASASSPYLLQHACNPVDWQEWNEASLAQARALNRPILLSIGYAACHWCHVMAHESFENETTAAVMNRLFVNIKVDREERPDLDTVYQQALAAIGQHGGWPLTMFLAPDGEPIWGGTYFPPEPRYGRPGFGQVLEQIHALWSAGDPRVTNNRQAITSVLRELSQPKSGGGIAQGRPFAVARTLAERFDVVHGGIAGAPKFPQAPVLRLLWAEACLTGDPILAHRVRHTLARICQGGIYDHLGGGFARYSVDACWLAPHFEKMLYDNAQLIELLASVYAATAEPLFRERAEETVAWLAREMNVDGGFASSLDADSEGEEGRFYVWDAAEIDRLLGEDAAAFRLAYGVTDPGNWEGRNILNRLHDLGLPPSKQHALLAACRERLLRARDQRMRPARDDKVLADWNGLTIAALAQAAGRFGRADWLELAKCRFAELTASMGEGDRLHHSRRGAQRLRIGFLDDYAQVSRAGVMLFQQTGDLSYLQQAETWLDRCRLDFADPARPGFFLSPERADGPFVRPRNAQDGPTPSANGTLAEVAAMLWHLTGEGRHRTLAETILTAFAGDAETNPAAHATLLLAADLLADGVQVVVVGTPEIPGFAELWSAATSAVPPLGVAQRRAATDDLPGGHPAAGKALLRGRATAYVCRGAACEAPIGEPDALRERLAAVRGRE